MDEQDIFHDTLYHVLHVYVIPHRQVTCPGHCEWENRRANGSNPAIIAAGNGGMGSLARYATYEERQE